MTGARSSRCSRPSRRRGSPPCSAPSSTATASASIVVRDGVGLTGVVSLPTFNRGMADQQFLFVNSRPVKDRLLVGALRAAYRDLIARDRHPVAALFLQVPLEDVDVNVHPAKTEVRFRDPQAVRGLIVGALRSALDAEGHRSAAREQVMAPAMWVTSGWTSSRRRPGSRLIRCAYSAAPASAGATALHEARALFDHAPRGRGPSRRARRCRAIRWASPAGRSGRPTSSPRRRTGW